MFANATNKVGISQQVVATLVAGAVVMFTLGVYNHTAQAASLTLIRDTLTTSEPAQTSAHTIDFTIDAVDGTALGLGDNTIITFETFTGVGSVTAANADVLVNDVDQPAATISGSGQDVTISNFTASAGDKVTVAIDDGVIINPALGSYDISIATPSDTGKAMVAIVNVVTLSAIVDTQFTFVIDGTATSTEFLTGLATTTGSTTPIEIPFGELVAGVPETLAQELSVATNAINGFSVKVQTDGALRSANGADIDAFVNGTEVTTSGTPWTSPTPDINNENTWGHWGMTSNDTDLANDLDAAASYISASTTAREIFSHDGPADGTTQDKGLATVGYQVEISALQEAADDYQTILTYIATPTF